MIVEVIGLEPSKWMMSPSERLAIIGLLRILESKDCLSLDVLSED